MVTKSDAASTGAFLLRRHRVAALGTLREGAPSVTMAPYALRLEPLALLVLVSGLASHTRAMVQDARTALLVAEPPRDGIPVHALARISLQAAARPITPGERAYLAARRAYEARFPEMRELFTLADFRLFALEPTSVRVVAGFAQAASVTPRALAAALRAAAEHHAGPA